MIYKLSNTRRYNKGITLIELLLVVVILGLVFSVGGAMIAEGFRATYTSRDIIDADWQARLALARITRDMRGMGIPFDIVAMTPGGNPVNFVDSTGQTTTYSLSGTTLMRNSQALAIGVSALAFTYYDQNFAVITNAAQTSLVRYIAISLTVTHGGTSRSFLTMVTPRNFR